MHLGVLADDFTGATDIAGFLVKHGMATIMFNGVPEQAPAVFSDALVVSLKIRSCPVGEAVEKALSALSFLKASGCTKFYYKYCSTFDSSREGNIGQVTDALLSALGTTMTLICPALPVNGRTVYKGYLFVQDRLLGESSMKNHPITPMLDSKLERLMEGQFKGACAHIFFEDMRKGKAHVQTLIESYRQEKKNYLIVDILDEEDLETTAQATEDFPLVTGGSGLALGIAHLYNQRLGRPSHEVVSFIPKKERTVVIAGSCSAQTNAQVAYYQAKAPSMRIDEQKCLNQKGYAGELALWALSQDAEGLAPLLYATRNVEELAQSKALYQGLDLSSMIERIIGCVTKILAFNGVKNFIVAGGETSGVVATTLGVSSYLIGPQIDPGVSWVRSLDGTMHLAFKSGNFGMVDFFEKAQEMCHA
ncbi:3-oxo-tetronate kinase [Sphaerochaeta sp. PS]|uniref:3-oxo-tetronate kinase n=1 Tax=Sphaerochaeta sp. PS TaxID=3076336 RepID=UPI0028A38166|nr:3-oxo-tetronate kinase [Sphaerochaeta sp. PS]MDT4762203.1 four-carbon acid sugar kinase family protein [Sphaerochaeta sp. PS]